MTGRGPVVDGRLDDAAWRDVPVATDFVASRPIPGGVPSLRTEARVVYDDEALYVAVRAYDPHPGAILAPYPRRDDEITSDWVFVEIDSRHNRRSGFSFGLNPRGVQVDGTWANDGDYDAAWNGVWTGAARIDSLGWTAEFRIPFSQLALPARRDSAVFGLNVYRASPRRGALLAGADARLRLTPALTLAATVRPDFGQVEADPSVVNLTAFETYFPEQRPFFVDGADRFAFNAVASAFPGDAPAAGFGLALADARHRFALGGTEPQYEASGFVAASRVAGTPAAVRAVEGDDIYALLRPDAPAAYRDDSTRRALDGTAAQLRVAKLAGHWLGSVTGHALSPGFSANDLGFQQNADWLLAAATFAYQRYEPGPIFRRWSVGVNRAGVGWNFAGERRAAVFGMKAAGELRNEWGGSVQLGREFTALATDVLRGGPALLVPPRTTWGATLHSDTRRATQLTVAVDGFREPATGGRALSVAPALDARVSDQLRVAVAPAVARRVDAWHYVGAAPDSGVVAPLGAPRFVVGRLREATASLTTRADLAFSARATLQLYAQPFVGTAAYDRFAAITDPRAPAVADRTRPLAGGLPAGVADPSFGTRRALATLVWRWEYRPGSTLFAVFTQRRTGDAADARWDPGGAVRAFGRDPTANVLLLKASYWWQP